MRITLSIILLALSALPAAAQITVSNVVALKAITGSTMRAQGSVRTLGYYTPGDGGGGQYRWVEGSTATNLPNQAVTGAVWELISDGKTITPFVCGAKGDGVTDDRAAIQAAIDWSGPHDLRLQMGGTNTFAIAGPIRFRSGLSGTNDYITLRLDGQHATLKVTAPTNAIQIEAKSVLYGSLQDLTITYDSAYTESTAVAVSYRGTGGSGPEYNNVYNVEHRNIQVLRGYRGFQQEEWCSVWGSTWERCFFSQEITGSAMKLSTASAFGNPNNQIANCYARADRMTQPVFELNQQTGLVMRNIEVNVVSNIPIAYVSASYGALLQNIRIEVGTYSTDYTGVIYTANNANLLIDGLEIQSVAFTAPTWSYGIRDVAAGPWADVPANLVRRLTFRACTKGSGYVGAVASDYRRVSVQGVWSDSATIPTSIPFLSAASLTNVTWLPVQRSVTATPVQAGEWTYAADGTPRVAIGTSSTNDWIKPGPGDVLGPASSTSNAVPRYGGTTGKQLVASSVGIDGDGNVSAPGQAHVFGAGSGNPSIQINGQAGGVRFLSYAVSGSERWRIAADATAESGGNAGSDLQISAYNGLTFLGHAIEAYRSNRLVRFGGPMQVQGPMQIYARGAPVTVSGPSLLTFVNTNLSGADYGALRSQHTGTAAYMPLQLEGETVSLQANGALAATFDSNAVAGETRFLLYDVSAGTVKRVSVGASDSGGTGYKVLRVPN